MQTDFILIPATILSAHHRKLIGSRLDVLLYLYSRANRADGLVANWDEEAAALQLGRSPDLVGEQVLSLADDGYLSPGFQNGAGVIQIHNWIRPLCKGGEIVSRPTHSSRAYPVPIPGTHFFCDQAEASSPQNDDNRRKSQDLKQSLLAIGLRRSTAARLVHSYPVETIEGWLALFPEAERLGIARSAGWLVRALDSQWDIRAVRARLDLKREKEQQKGVWLPEELIDKIRSTGWDDAYTEIEERYLRDPQLVEKWLDYVLAKGYGAGKFRVGLRSGVLPPETIPLLPPAEEAYLANLDPELDEIACSRQAEASWEEALAVWEAALSSPDERTAFERYVKGKTRGLLLREEENSFYVVCASKAGCRWLSEQGSETALSCLAQILGGSVEIVFVERWQVRGIELD